MQRFFIVISRRVEIIVAALCFILLVAHGFAEERNLSVVLVGDSTVADWSKEKPARGWGQVLAPLLAENVHLTNLAVCGASTKTFPATGNWQRALELKPDFVLLQFGHNDSHSPDKPEATKAETEYASNLEHFVLEARAAGIVPVLVTPVHRRMFDPQGKPTGELGPYAEAMKQVAENLRVPLIDLYGSSGALFTRLGEQGSATFTVSEQDRTHFTGEGAAAVAALVVEGMRTASPELALIVRGNPVPR
ncbi:MAG: rhamnogalacturonan acetylesterase [Terrimicrobiaceae bacterium]